MLPSLQSNQVTLLLITAIFVGLIVPLSSRLQTVWASLQQYDSQPGAQDTAASQSRNPDGPRIIVGTNDVSKVVKVIGTLACIVLLLLPFSPLILAFATRDMDLPAWTQALRQRTPFVVLLFVTMFILNIYRGPISYFISGDSSAYQVSRGGTGRPVVARLDSVTPLKSSTARLVAVAAVATLMVVPTFFGVTQASTILAASVLLSSLFLVSDRLLVTSTTRQFPRTPLLILMCSVLAAMVAIGIDTLTWHQRSESARQEAIRTGETVTISPFPGRAVGDFLKDPIVDQCCLVLCCFTLIVGQGGMLVNALTLAYRFDMRGTDIAMESGQADDKGATAKENVPNHRPIRLSHIMQSRPAPSALPTFFAGLGSMALLMLLGIHFNLFTYLSEDYGSYTESVGVVSSIAYFTFTCVAYMAMLATAQVASPGEAAALLAYKEEWGPPRGETAV